MNFNFIDDPEWAGLDNETKTKVLGAAFQRDISSDKEWGGLPADTQQSIWDTYHKQAGEFEQSLQPAEQEHGFVGELAAGLGRGALRVAATPAYLADVAGEAIGFEGLEKAGEYGAEKVEEFIAESPRLRKSQSISGDIRDNPQLWTDPRWYASIVGEGAPTIASMILPGMAAARVAKVAGMGVKGIQAARMGGALTAGMGLEAGGAAEDIRQYEKRTGEKVPISKKLQTVAGTGVVAGSLEAVPVFNLFGKAVAKKLIGRIITSMALEGGTEGAQEIVANAFAKAGYEADRDMVGGVIESVVGGVLLGGGMGAMQQTFQERIKNTDADKVSDILEEAEGETQQITPTEELSESDTLSQAINQGLSPEGINGQVLTPEQAIATIQEAYTDNIFTDEHINQFKEQYPELRPALNEIVPDVVLEEPVIQPDLDTTENEKMFATDPLNAENNADYLNKYIQKSRMPKDTTFADRTAEMKRDWSRQIGQLLRGGDKNIAAINEIASEAESNLSAEDYATWWGEQLDRVEQIRQSVVGAEGLKKELAAKERKDVLMRTFGMKPKKPEAAQEIVEGEVGKEVEKAEAGKELIEVTREKSINIVKENFKGKKENMLSGWFRNADKTYKPKIVKELEAKPELKNAAINIFHSEYQIGTGTEIPFNEFINKDIKVYRYGDIPSDEPFVSFSYNKEMAKKFEGAGKEAIEITIKPKDIYGMLQTIAEGEVLVPTKQLLAEYPNLAPAKPQTIAPPTEKPSKAKVFKDEDLKDKIVTIKTIDKKTNKLIETKQDAKTALNEAETKSETMYKLLNCLD